MRVASVRTDPSLLTHLDFHVRGVEHADARVLCFLLDALALASADLRGDADGLDLTVDALQVVHVVDADFLEARWVFATGRLRRSEAGFDGGTLTLDTAALFREGAAWLAPGRRNALFLVMVLSVELRATDAVSLGQQSGRLVVEGRRLVGETTGLEFRLHVLRCLGFLLAFLFDLGFRLGLDFETADVGLDTGGQRVADAVRLGQFGLLRGADVVDRLEASV